MNNAYFHFTEKGNLKSIAQNGLKAQIGDASKLVDDKSRVCFSQGVKGILGIKNSFIFFLSVFWAFSITILLSSTFISIGSFSLHLTSSSNILGILMP